MYEAPPAPAQIAAAKPLVLDWLASNHGFWMPEDVSMQAAYEPSNIEGAEFEERFVVPLAAFRAAVNELVADGGVAECAFSTAIAHPDS